MHEIRLTATSTLHEAKQSSRHLLTEVRHEAHQSLGAAQRQVPALMAEIRTEAENVLTTARTVSATRLEGIRDRAKLDLVRGKEGMYNWNCATSQPILGACLPTQRHPPQRCSVKLPARDPRKRLGRGFAIVRNGAGKPVTSQAGVRSGDALDIEFRDGHVTTQAT